MAAECYYNRFPFLLAVDSLTHERQLLAIIQDPSADSPHQEALRHGKLTILAQKNRGQRGELNP